MNQLVESVSFVFKAYKSKNNDVKEENTYLEFF